jgi:lipid-A-disaccharide synthase
VTLLVVCGEPSGDRAAAKVIERLAERSGVRSFGIAGPSCAAAGLEACAPAERSAVLGVLDVAARAARLLASLYAVRAAIVRRRPRAAMLVSYTDFNVRLLGLLRRSGVRVLWYAAPQVWAWRPRRARKIARAVDAMAVILPFEESLWRDHGAAARYVGHPAMEIACLSRDAARAELGIADGVHATAILPGSRPREVRRLLPAMLGAVRGDVKRNATARVVLTMALDDDVRTWAHAQAEGAGVTVHEVSAKQGAPRVLAAFDDALCASGTASLEAVMANVPPVVAYRLDPVAAFVARRLLETPHVALPNVLLGRRAFPELLQDDARADPMRDALDGLTADRDRALADCAQVRDVLGENHTPSRVVADMIAPWL